MGIRNIHPTQWDCLVQQKGYFKVVSQIIRVVRLTSGILIMASFCALAEPGDTAEIVIFPVPTANTRIQESKNFWVTVNGKKVTVRNLSKTSDAWFAFAGEIEVKITVKEPVKSYTLSPLSAGIKPFVSGSDITFRLKTPRKLVLHNVNTIDEVLAIWADPIPGNIPSPKGSNVVNIVNHGVDNSGSTDVTAKIQNLINNLAQDKLLYVPFGVYKVTNLILKDNTRIYFEPGSVFEFETDKGTLISAFGCDNIHIFGHGTINCNGQYYSGGSDSNRKAKTIGNSGANQKWEDFCIRESQHWTWISASGASNGSVYNVKLLMSHDGLNRDGIDPNDWQGLHMDDVFMYTGDDCMAINCTSPKDLRMVIRNAVLWNMGSGANIKIGPYWDNVCSNVRVENCDFIDAPRNISFLDQNDKAARPENIVFRNVRCENAWNNLMDMRSRGGCVNVRFENLAVRHNKPSIFAAQSSIDMVFDNFTRNGAIISTASEANFSGSTSQIKFTNSIATIVGIEAVDLYADESGVNTAIFRVYRTGSLSKPLTVRYSIRGTATNGIDYEKIDSSVIIPLGDSSNTVEIKPIADNTTEYFETVLLRLELSDLYMTGVDFQAQLIIRDSYQTSLKSLVPINGIVNRKQSLMYDICGRHINPKKFRQSKKLGGIYLSASGERTVKYIIGW